MLWSVPVALALASGVSAHTAAFAKGMYCEGGPDPNNYNANSNTVVNPLYQLEKEEWWMQADRGCDKVPPPDGAILELPAGGQFTVELAHNQAQTTLSFDGQYTSDWPDGADHPEDWSGTGSPPGCIPDDGAMHTQNQSMAAGTAFAISYESDISKVTMENLVVFTTLEHTPWKRIATYDVPKDLPSCPPGGCYCAWLWLPNGCGIPNMYMSNFACNVTGSTSTKKLDVAQPPVYCGDDQSKCVKGAKQMLAWNQASGDNVEVPSGVSPAYGTNMGWSNGAQDDIFVDGGEEATPVESASSVASDEVPRATASVVPSSVVSDEEPSATASEAPGSVDPVVAPSATVIANASSADSSVPTTLATVVAPVVTVKPAPTSSRPCKSKSRHRTRRARHA